MERKRSRGVDPAKRPRVASVTNVRGAPRSLLQIRCGLNLCAIRLVSNPGGDATFRRVHREPGIGGDKIIVQQYRPRL